MSADLITARTIDTDATEKTDAVFGRMIVCSDSRKGLAVAEALHAAGRSVLWSHRINPERVFLDPSSGGGIFRG